MRADEPLTPWVGFSGKHLHSSLLLVRASHVTPVVQRSLGNVVPGQVCRLRSSMESGQFLKESDEPWMHNKYLLD